MEEKYIQAVIKNSSEFCDIYNNYNEELIGLGTKFESVAKEVQDYQNNISTNGNPSADSYNFLPDDVKYRDESNNIIPYENLTEKQKRGLTHYALFIPDKEIELNDKLKEATYNMGISARKFVKDLQDKIEQITRSERYLNQLNVQYAADFSRYGNVADDCLYDLNRATTAAEKEEINARRSDALKNMRKIGLKTRINATLIEASMLFESVFSNTISNINDSIKKEFEVTEENDYTKDKIDILSDLGKLMSSFANFKSNYDSEKELIDSINERCKEMNKSIDSKDIAKFTKDVRNVTKDFSKIIQEIEQYNKDMKITYDNSLENSPENNGPENNGPENKGPENNGPENNGPENKGPENNGPENKGPENNGPENKGPENKGPENKGPESNGSVNNGQGSNPDDNGTGNNGTASDELDENEPRKSQNEDAELRVNRSRMAHAALRGRTLWMLSIALLASSGLGFVPPLVPAVVKGLLLGDLAAEGISRLKTIIIRNGATHKLNKIAKKMCKVGLNIRLGDFDYENGTVDYILTTDDGEEIKLRNADGAYVNAEYLRILNSELSKSFKNDRRGIASPKGKFETDMQVMPKVTANNLEAAYAQIGGIRSFKDDILIEAGASAWKTATGWIADRKDQLFKKNIEDREDNNVKAAASLDDLNENKTAPTQEDVEVEVTPTGTPTEENSNDNLDFDAINANEGEPNVSASGTEGTPAANEGEPIVEEGQNLGENNTPSEEDLDPAKLMEEIDEADLLDLEGGEQTLEESGPSVHM